MEIVDIDSWSSSKNFTTTWIHTVHTDKENIANGKLMLTAVAQQVPDLNWTGADRCWILLQHKSPFLMGKSQFLMGKLTLNHHFQ